MEPCASCRMYLIGTRVRPSSTESWTGMSSTIWMSCIGLALAEPPEVTGAVADSNTGAPSSLTLTVAACSSRAWAQSSVTASFMVFGVSVDIGLSQPVHINAAQVALDAQRVFAFVGAVLAFENGHAVHMGLDRGTAVELDEIA